MADGQKTQLRLEIAHVLFMDIVGYSKLLIDEQSEALQELNQIVRKTEAVRAAEAPAPTTKSPRLQWNQAVIALLLLAILIATGVFFFRRQPTPQIPAAAASNSPAPVAAAIPEKSIAVLPFENMSR